MSPRPGSPPRPRGSRTRSLGLTSLGFFALFGATALVGSSLASCDGGSDAAPAPGPTAGGAGGGGAGGGGNAGTSAGGAAGSPTGGASGAPSTSFCGTDGVSKGPWVVGADETTARIRWESCVRGNDDVVFTPEGGGEARTALATTSTYEVKSEYKSFLQTVPRDLPGVWTMHEAKLEGLSAGTCYRYEVAGSKTDGGRFCTARPSGQPLTFLAIGDTNPGLNDSTTRILKAVLPQNPDFTIHQGDMQYYDSGFETYASWFPLMQPLLSQGAILPALGNHELEKPDELEAYYERFFGRSGEDIGKSYYRFASAGLHFFSLDTEQSIAPESEQGAWLTAGLVAAKSQPGFIGSIVFMHRPFATCGESGQLTEDRLAYAPTFQENGVRLIVAGHAHGYERFVFGDLTYVVTGGGGGLMGDPDENKDRAECASRVASAAKYHAIGFKLEGKIIQADVVDLKGESLDTFEIAMP